MGSPIRIRASLLDCARKPFRPSVLARGASLEPRWNRRAVGKITAAANDYPRRPLFFRKREVDVRAGTTKREEKGEERELIMSGGGLGARVPVQFSGNATTDATRAAERVIEDSAERAATHNKIPGWRRFKFAFGAKAEAPAL